MIYRALTVCQPWAELIVSGKKRVENRKWRTDYRGPLVIHAGKSREWLDPALLRRELLNEEHLAFGAAVGLAYLEACLHVRQAWPKKYHLLRGHPYTEGPWCWILRPVRRFTPPYRLRGSLGLFEVELPEFVG